MHRVRTLAQEERQDRAQVPDPVLDRRRGHQQHFGATAELGRGREALRASRTQMVCFVNNHDLRRGLRRSPAAPAEHLHRDKVEANAGARCRVQPDVPQRGRRDDNRIAGRLCGRERHVRLAEPYVVGEKRAAVLIEESLDALHALSLVRMQDDTAELPVTARTSDHVRRDRGSDVVGRRDVHLPASSRAATSEGFS